MGPDMADFRDVEASDQSEPGPVDLLAYNLEFNLARCEAYHNSEARFYLYADRALTVAHRLALILAGSSSVAAQVANNFVPSWLVAVLFLAWVAAQELARILKFKQQKTYHARAAAKCTGLRAELELHRGDSKRIRRLWTQMLHSWEEQPGRYVVHYAVDAQAYNEAVRQLHPAGNASRSLMLKLRWWERLTAHFVPYSPDSILRHQDKLRESIA
jgi:hypothetical protein